MSTKTNLMTLGAVSGLLIGLVLGTAQIAGATGPATAVTLSAKLSKAGLGCKDLKATKDKVLYSGKRWTCTVKGLQTNIEFYTSSNLKKAGKYLCDSGVDYPLVTDGKSWTISTGDFSVDKAVAKALGVKIIKACRL